MSVDKEGRGSRTDPWGVSVYKGQAGEEGSAEDRGGAHEVSIEPKTAEIWTVGREREQRTRSLRMGRDHKL